MKTIKYDINKVEDRYKHFLITTILMVEQVINDKRFLINLKAEKKRTGFKGEKSIWKNKSAQEIYNQLFPISLEIKTYYTSDNVIAYGLPSTKTIHLNRKYLDKYKDDYESYRKAGGNLIHEHSHDCGFKHDFNKTANRDSSISYTLNRVFEKTFNEVFMIEDESAPVKKYTPWYKKLIRKLTYWF